MTDAPKQKLLVVHASPRADESQSRRLGEKFLQALPPVQVRRHDLALRPPSHIDASWARAEGRLPSARDESDRAALKASDALVDDVLWSDSLLVTTPMYNFTIPSALKAWLDLVTRSERTFAFGTAGPYGLLQGRSAIVVATFGMVYEAEPMRSMDFLEPPLRLCLGWLGVSPIEVVRAEGLLIGSESEREARIKLAENRLVELASEWAAT